MALTNAERQRRYIARIKAKAAATNEPVTNVTHDLVSDDEDVYDLSQKLAAIVVAFGLAGKQEDLESSWDEMCEKHGDNASAAADEMVQRAKGEPDNPEKPDLRDRLLRWLLREIYRDQYLDKMVKRNGLPEA
jgi:hypothetical protein